MVQVIRRKVPETIPERTRHRQDDLRTQPCQRYRSQPGHPGTDPQSDCISEYILPVRTAVRRESLEHLDQAAVAQQRDQRSDPPTGPRPVRKKGERREAEHVIALVPTGAGKGLGQRKQREHHDGRHADTQGEAPQRGLPSASQFL